MSDHPTDPEIMGEVSSSPDHDEEVTQRLTVAFPPLASTSVAYSSSLEEVRPQPKAKVYSKNLSISDKFETGVEQFVKLEFIVNLKHLSEKCSNMFILRSRRDNRELHSFEGLVDALSTKAFFASDDLYSRRMLGLRYSYPSVGTDGTYHLYVLLGDDAIIARDR
ncbi:Uncharacterized protein Fot_35877 [Forsythia ovata]|uniref:Uncharacterized protein n=1 Tax=Forsythia ovata TaxID=205694 RepID=A0ABD1SQI3_9LAMI